jgi:hypothetical protein
MYFSLILISLVVEIKNTKIEEKQRNNYENRINLKRTSLFEINYNNRLF